MHEDYNDYWHFCKSIDVEPLTWLEDFYEHWEELLARPKACTSR